jgi:hypothetical protein
MSWSADIGADLGGRVSASECTYQWWWWWWWRCSATRQCVAYHWLVCVTSHWQAASWQWHHWLETAHLDAHWRAAQSRRRR